MRMKRVEGILAVSKNNVIGQGNSLPWSHKGDLKRFRSITMGNGVLIGYPTFLSIAEKYTISGKQILPGRIVLVVGREPLDLPTNLDLSNVITIPTYGAKDDIETALGYLSPEQTLFIAGGARVYRDYLQYAEKIHLTNIDCICPVDYDTVFLTSETAWGMMGSSWRSIIENGYEISDGVKASYVTMSAV